MAASDRIYSSVESPLMSCRLEQRPDRVERSPTSGRVFLQNCSRVNLTIIYDTHPLSHLDLIVHDIEGKLLPTRHYGTYLFTLFDTFRQLELAPGEIYSHNVSLLRNVEPEITSPGTFDVHAEYAYADRIFRSNVVRVVLKKAHLLD